MIDEDGEQKVQQSSTTTRGGAARRTMVVATNNEDSRDNLQEVIFPKRLMGILENPSNHDCIQWGSGGKSFSITDEDTFEKRIMPRLSTRKSKFSSFLRKLNRWGFSLITKGPAAGHYYQHDFFQRDKPHLVSQMYYYNGRTKEALRQDVPKAPCLLPPTSSKEDESNVADTTSLTSNRRFPGTETTLRHSTTGDTADCTERRSGGADASSRNHSPTARKRATPDGKQKFGSSQLSSSPYFFGADAAVASPSTKLSRGTGGTTTAREKASSEYDIFLTNDAAPTHYGQSSSSSRSMHGALPVSSTAEDRQQVSRPRLADSFAKSIILQQRQKEELLQQQAADKHYFQRSDLLRKRTASFLDAKNHEQFVAENTEDHDTSQHQEKRQRSQIYHEDLFLRLRNAPRGITAAGPGSSAFSGEFQGQSLSSSLSATRRMRAMLVRGYNEEPWEKNTTTASHFLPQGSRFLDNSTLLMPTQQERQARFLSELAGSSEFAGVRQQLNSVWLSLSAAAQHDAVLWSAGLGGQQQQQHWLTEALVGVPLQGQLVSGGGRGGSSLPPPPSVPAVFGSGMGNIACGSSPPLTATDEQRRLLLGLYPTDRTTSTNGHVAAMIRLGQQQQTMLSGPSHQQRQSAITSALASSLLLGSSSSSRRPSDPGSLFPAGGILLQQSQLEATTRTRTGGTEGLFLPHAAPSTEYRSATTAAPGPSFSVSEYLRSSSRRQNTGGETPAAARGDAATIVVQQQWRQSSLSGVATNHTREQEVENNKEEAT